MFPPTAPFPTAGPYSKNLAQYSNIPILPSTSYYGAGTSLQPTPIYYNQGLIQTNNRNGQANYGRLGITGVNGKGQQQQQKSGQRINTKNSHLRVGGKFFKEN